MKYNSIIALTLLIGVLEIKAIRINNDSEITGSDDASDLDSLMDKYDDAEKEKDKPKKLPKKVDASGNPIVSTAQVQDYELKILSGNDLATSSQKAADDDLFNDVIEKFSSQSKEQKDVNILSKENAKEAATELLSKKDGIDMVDAEAKMRKSSFAKLWDEHDNMSKGFIDTTEAYGLMQDISRADE